MVKATESRWRKALEWLGHAHAVYWLLSAAFGAAVLVSKSVQATDVTPYLEVGGAFVGTLAMGTGSGYLVKYVWNRFHPPTLITIPRGGDGVSVEVCPSIDSEFYGHGWFIGENTRKETSFRIKWDYHGTERYIRAGDKATFHLAELQAPSRPYDLPVLNFLGDGGILGQLGIRRDEVSGPDYRLKEPSAWIEVRVELRCEAHPRIWTNSYRYRLDTDWRFHVEETTTP